MTSIYSNASNFSSAIDAGVDLRTGLPRCNLTLCTLRSIAQPDLDLSIGLSYSILNTASQLFGTGWSLSGLSSCSLIHSSQWALSLSDGRTFLLVQDLSILQVVITFKDKKLNDFFVTPLDKNNLVIVYKDGKEETLTRFRQTDGFYLTKITFPTGEVFSFTWDLLNSPTYLKSVTDSNDTPLLSFSYQNNNIRSATVQSTASLQAVFYFSYQNTDLSKITILDLGNVTLGEWGFFYSRKLNYSILERMSSNSGLLLEFFYDSTHNLDDLTSIPCISKLISHPVRGQASTYLHYSYSSNNFLGFQSGVAHAPGEDNLYRILGHYNYDATETIKTSGGSVLQTRKATFNKFHLMTSHEFEEAGCKITTAIEYNDLPNAQFELQPANLQLPKKISTTYQSSSSSETREEWEEISTDDYGNETRREDNFGRVIASSYYPIEGEGVLCPAEPKRYFVKYLKKTEFSCSETDEKKENEYTYLQVSINSAPFVVDKQTTYKHNNIVRHVITKEYGLNANRLKALPTSVKSSIGGAVITYNYTYSLLGSVLTVLETVLGTDKNSVQHGYKTDVILGGELSQTNTEAQTISWEYDALGRVVRVVTSPDTAWEQLWVTSYLESNFVTETHPGNMKTQLELDGLGRVIRESVADSKGIFQPLIERTYDTLGRLIEAVVKDYSADGSEIVISHPVTFGYDGWGLVSTVTQPGQGVTTVINDPINLIQSTSAADSKVNSLSTEHITFHPAFKTPVQIEERNGNKVYRCTLVTYDAFGRPISATLPAGETVEILDYDSFDRPTKVKHLDNSVFELTYSSLTQESVLTQIAALRSEFVSVILGNRVFDDIGRLMSETVNSVTRMFEYPSSSLQPSSFTNSRGQMVRLERSPYRGKVTSISGETLPERTFTYTMVPVVGMLSKADCRDGTYEFEYNTAGQLIHSIQKTQSSTYETDIIERSLSGRVTKVRTTGNRVLVATNSLNGRLAQFSDDQVAVSYTYDSFGRPHTIKVTDNNQEIETTTLTYDVYNRETNREVLIKAAGTSHRLEIAYGYDTQNKVIARTISVDLDTLTEAFTYDARQRLVSYRVENYSSENLLPKNEYGRGIQGQDFEYDDINNLTQLITTLQGGGQVDIATLEYVGTQLRTVQHQPRGHQNGYPDTTELDYDLDGNLTQVRDDGQPRISFSFNSLGQISDNNGVVNSYDALGLLASYGDNIRHYLGNSVIGEFDGTGVERRLVSLGGMPVVEIKGSEKRWLQTDGNNSVVGECVGATWSYAGYTPAGDGGGESRYGYNGELRDACMKGNSAAYPLGNGSRLYLPCLGVFASMDTLSPFGEGGLNPYRYCHGDPVNLRDPSGHVATTQLVGGIIGVFTAILGIVLAIPTGGASLTLTVAGEIMLGAAELAASAVAIGLAATDDKKGARIANGVAGLMALGSMGMGMGTAGAKKGGAKSRGGMFSRSSNVTTGYKAWDESFDTFDLYRSPTGQNKRVIITAHGVQTLTDSKVEVHAKQMRFFSSDGYSLEDPGLNPVAWNLYTPRERMNAPTGGSVKVRNYNLSKYSQDTPRNMRTAADMYNVDIIGVTKNTDLKTIIETLNSNGVQYETIDGFFCRTKFVDAILDSLHIKDAPSQKASAEPFGTNNFLPKPNIP